jgi:hypothetical protein
MLFWVALGCTLRLSRRRRVGWIGLGAAAIFLMLCSYQALTLCLLLLPAIAIAARIVRPATGRGGWLGVIGWSSAIPALGLLAYAGYSRIAPSIFGHNSYESLLINTQAQMRSLSGIASLVGSAYDTAYVQDPWTQVQIATLLAAVVGPRVMAAPSPIEQNRALAALAAALAALPLLAMPFAVNTAFLADPQKVDLPVAVGLVVLLVGGLVRYPGARPSPVQGADPASGPGSDPASDPGSDPGSNVVSGPRSGPQTGRKLASCLAVAALISTGILGLGARRQSAVEESVIGQTARLLKAHHASSVVVWDYTGRLGDLYSLYEFKHLLTLGVLARGTRVTTATICTPLGVDRVQPYAQHLHWALTPTCQALHLAPATLRLNAVGGPSGPILRSHG